MYRLAFLLLFLGGSYILDMIIVYSSTDINHKSSVISIHTALVVFVLFVLVCVSVDWGIELCQQEAVEMGHARYVVDKSHNVKFKWLATQTAELTGQRGYKE